VRPKKKNSRIGKKWRNGFQTFKKEAEPLTLTLFISKCSIAIWCGDVRQTSGCGAVSAVGVGTPLLQDGGENRDVVCRKLSGNDNSTTTAAAAATAATAPGTPASPTESFNRTGSKTCCFCWCCCCSCSWSVFSR